jgi:hypothetical protein
MTKQRAKRQQGPAHRDPTDDVTERRRVINNCVGYWRVCGAGACRRQRGCAGDAVACFKRFWPWTPERIKIRIRACIKALSAGITSAAEVGRIVDAEVERAAEHIARVDAETDRAWEAKVAAERADAPHPARSASHPLPASGEREERRSGPRVRAL